MNIYTHHHIDIFIQINPRSKQHISLIERRAVLGAPRTSFAKNPSIVDSIYSRRAISWINLFVG